MHYYIAVVHQDGDSAYGLSFPDLPGCFAASDTWDGIPKAATEALDLWFEDQPDIEPASLEDVRAHQEVIEEMKDGAVLMPVPYIPADTATVRANISIERGLLRAIDEAAKARGMSRSGLISSATRREIAGAA
ncbi:type II toxin-antitoxin system HicB family antitoxin [uncultured Thioclava sp.]|uniref:type II toxin-antitoxin system HicB family antitoxin n=1 Tax=uncultured Thioclava sp. TaxID=473858 RepID=UPI0025E39273|nr:type II toxin-antitoxin system HicB family antitoxin [uncultured Thioclava sp.]